MSIIFDDQNLRNDWKPETRSLLHTLIAAGFILVSGDNGEEKFLFNGNLNKFIDNLIACDESWLYVKIAGRTDTLCLYLVLGNSPGELVCDYTVSETLDQVTQAHYDKWSQRKQPTVYK